MTDLSPRVRARLALSRALRPVPLSLVEKARRANVGSQAKVLRPLVAILRHRPLGDVETFELADRPGFRLMGTDSLMVRRLFWFGEGGYEGAEVRCWRDFCSRSERIVEMGANVGFYTVHAGLAAPRAKVTAVEAHPVSAAVVRANLELNGVTNVEVIQAAVVGKVTSPTIELRLPDAEQYEAPTGAYVTGAEVADRPAGATVTVPVVAAADIVAGADLLKLDIEGLEADVLAAVEDQVVAARPVIFLEVIRSATRLRELIADWRSRHGYAVFAIGHDGLRLLSGDDLHAAKPLPRFGTRDVILIPREQVDAV